MASFASDAPDGACFEFNKEEKGRVGDETNHRRESRNLATHEMRKAGVDVCHNELFIEKNIFFSASRPDFRIW